MKSGYHKMPDGKMMKDVLDPDRKRDYADGKD